MGAIGELTRARIGHRPGRWILVALGVALALALPVISAATGRVVATRALEAAVESLPVGERTVVAAYGGRDLSAVQAGHPVVEQRHLRPVLSNELQRGQSVVGLANHVDGATGRKGANHTVAEQRMVVTHHHGHFLAMRRAGHGVSFPHPPPPNVD